MYQAGLEAMTQRLKLSRRELDSTVKLFHAASDVIWRDRRLNVN
jgi:hypothetical protein